MFQTCKKGALEYLTADSLEGSVHCFSTRLGGVSTGVLESLNLGVHRGDAPENVLENYRILGEAVGFSPRQTVFPMQRHTARIRRVGRENCGEGLWRDVPEVCDGLITNEPGVALCCFSADCTPILLYDPEKQAIAAVHAGWRGTAQGIAAQAVRAMQQAYGCRAEEIRAAIGPCIGRCCFETGPEVPQAMRDALGPAAQTAIFSQGEKFHVDLKALNRQFLLRAGVRVVDVSEDCTMCRPERFWSHRVTQGARGSLAGIIMLREGGASCEKE